MMPGQERPDVNAGGKIIMPPSSLESLSRLNISFPMLFKVENKAKGRFINDSPLKSTPPQNVNFTLTLGVQCHLAGNEPKTERISHTGVLEFIADEGKVYLPGWMMRNLLLGEGMFGNPFISTSSELRTVSSLLSQES